MADKGKNCSLWLNFFRDAGITGGFETKYALIFDENRIKMSMMLDLNKECLRDMGIKAMGDIIAILKHAKVVHDESMEQAFQTSKPTQSQSQPVNIRPEVEIVNVSASPPKFSTVAAPATSSKVTASKEFPAAKEKSPEVTASSTSQSQPQHVFRIPAVPKPKDPNKVPNINKKVPWILGGGSITLPRKRVIQLRTPDSEPKQLQEEVPVQKKIRVLPEQEGKYKIKMPSGSVVRGKTLENRLGPSKSDTAAEKKTGIFNRLGESKVTSTSTIERSVSRNIKPISFNDDEESSSSKSSVFARLGGRASASATSNSNSPPVAKPTSTLRLISSTVSTKSKELDRDRQRDRIEIRRKISPSTSRDSNRSSLSNSEGLPRVTRVFRNTLKRDDSPPPRSRTVGSTFRMHSEMEERGKSSSIKSRLDIRRPSSSSSSTSDSPSQRKKINVSTVRTIHTQLGESSRKAETNPQPPPKILTNSSSTKTITRVVTRKVRPDFEDPIQIVDIDFDLPELDDPMAHYYELD